MMRAGVFCLTSFRSCKTSSGVHGLRMMCAKATVTGFQLGLLAALDQSHYSFFEFNPTIQKFGYQLGTGISLNTISAALSHKRSGMG
jgi:hypothetical protein